MEAIERYSTSNDLLTLIILLLLVLLVASKKLFENRFEDFTSLLTSGKYLTIKSREHKALFGFNVLMLMVHILIISLLIFVLYRRFFYLDPDNTEIVFLRILTGYGFFVLLKNTVEKIIANVFDIDETADLYLFHKHSYRNFISLLFLPAIIFLVYTATPSLEIIIIFTAAFFLSIVFALSRVVKKSTGLISRNWFYFILYLCALEITPYVILYKLIVLR